MKHVVVLGAGLQGVCCALALARAGHRVTLVDGAPDCLMGASASNEGKIHLGLVYANDRSLRTPSLMLDSALAFGPLLEEWLDRPIPWKPLSAVPFTYVVLEESMLPAERILESWTRLQVLFDERARHERPRYLGTCPDRLWWPSGGDSSERTPVVNRASLAVRTAELALDVIAFRSIVRAKAHETEHVRGLFRHHVRGVERTPAGFLVEGTGPEQAVWRQDADAVVNCLWDGRLALDRQMGLVPSRPWVYRLKYRLLGRLPARLCRLPSLTLMLGRFGDLVNYGDGRVYLSWYPTCLRGWSTDLEVPQTWHRACRGDVPSDEARSVAEETLEGFDAIVPGLKECRIDSVRAGVIFSWGKTDIDDPDSELHRRDDIGPSAHDGYISVNTGKFTAAPLFARRVVDLVA